MTAPAIVRLAAILRRRLIDASNNHGKGAPLWSGEGARFSDLLILWHGGVDHERLEDLIYGMALIDPGYWTSERIERSQIEHDPTPDLQSHAVSDDVNDICKIEFERPIWRGRPLLTNEELQCAFALPRVYALLKVCFIGGRLPARPVEGKTVGRTGDEPYPPSEIEILNLLRAGRLREALQTAARKLRAKGYPPIFDMRDEALLELDMPQHKCRELAGMMLIPVRHVGVLASLTIKPRVKTY